jgi:hypothetical protein
MIHRRTSGTREAGLASPTGVVAALGDAASDTGGNAIDAGSDEDAPGVPLNAEFGARE